MVLEDNIKIVNVDLAYIARLHEACSEVYYKPQNYDRKPYIGILLTTDGNKYVIPLTSAKDKHRNWKNTYFDRMLISGRISCWIMRMICTTIHVIKNCLPFRRSRDRKLNARVKVVARVRLV